jgi:RNA polymerase sigma factor (TIGR02999 family)
LDALFARVYGALRDLAQIHLRGGGGGRTLSPTVLVHEASMKLLGPASSGALNDRTHFFAVASRAMRQILLDHARASMARKRGGGAVVVTLDEHVVAGLAEPADVLALNEALDALAEQSERLARLVEMRFFAGLNDGEIAAVLGISPRTVQRDWRTARAFLSRRLQDDD